MSVGSTTDEPSGATPDASLALVDERDYERRLQQETQFVRARQSLRTLPLVLLGGTLFIWTLWTEAPPASVLLWIGLVFACAWLRSVVCRRVLARLEAARSAEESAREAHDAAALARLEREQDVALPTQERWLAQSSAPAFLAMGSGFWLVAAPGTERAVVIVTMLACIYSFGSAVNASVHFRTFAFNTVLNLGQGIAYLLFAGGWQPTVGVSVIGTGILLLYFGRENARTFAESIRIREQNVRLVEQLERALGEARDANLAKSRFLAAASHDLRQPLSALGAFTIALTQRRLDDGARSLVSLIEDTSNVLTAQFDALLDLSRFDAGAVEVRDAEFSIAALLGRVVEGNREAAETKGLALDLVAPDVFVRSDRLLVERVASNLVVNAVTYTVHGTVQVEAEVAGDRVRVSVRDTGPGIAPEDRERIFEDFEQVENQARQREHGTGLGLAIVRRIDSLLGLDLHLESVPGTGSTFEFALPLAAARPRAASEPATRAMPASDLTPVVWVVDDDANVREAMTVALGGWGCEVLTGTSRADLERVYRERGQWPHLALLDDMLGEDESGLDIARWLGSSIPDEDIVIVTGNVDPHRREALEDGGFSVLLKPLGRGTLEQLVAGARRRCAAGANGREASAARLERRAGSRTAN